MNPLYIYNPKKEASERYYDEAVAASTMQGIYNRVHGPALYFLNDGISISKKWLDIFTSEGEWLHNREQQHVDGFIALAQLTRPDIKGVIVWDPTVPATLNVACTIAGVEDRVALSPDLYTAMASIYEGLPVTSLVGRFDGSETGSAKNDAYRWAIREYLEKGKCSDHFLALYEDSAFSRSKGNDAYVVLRDWPVYNRAFVYDLSPWKDEKPEDDPGQPLGTDYETYKLLLAAQAKQMDGKKMTEVCGFFCFEKYSNFGRHKSSHDPVPTEWQTVWLISKYNCYQNTATENCLNQSLHSQFGLHQLKQNDHPAPIPVENKCYLCFQMCDYDSAYPLYDFMPRHWDDSKRGTLPLAWGVNPNLMESYPDLFDYFYRTRTENDTFVGDASAAGYFNPSRIPLESWDMVTEHNKYFYKMADMSMSPMVLDQFPPSDFIKDQFVQFSPDGYATIIGDDHHCGSKAPEPHVWKGMTVDEMISIGDNNTPPKATAENINFYALANAKPGEPFFRYLRIIWVSPSHVLESMEELKKLRPDLDFVLVDPYNYFKMYGEVLRKQGKFQG